MTHLTFHPLANVFPLLEGEEFDALVADIAASGLCEAVWLYEGQILDGRNRYRACQRLGRDCATRDYSGHDPLGFVLIHAPDDIASFLRYPLVRFLKRGGWQRCGGFS